MAKEETPILPQAAAFLVISYLVYRFFFTSSSSSSASSAPSSSAGGTSARSPRRIDAARLRQQVETVHGMFPQFSAAAVEAELIRNGGSIEVATERILNTGFLPEPPQSVLTAAAGPAEQASRRPAAAAANPSRHRQPQTGQQSSSALPARYPDLITRYNLQSRLAEERSKLIDNPSSSASSGGGGGGGKGKAPASKQDRQLAHKAKRDEMIVAARCRVEMMIEDERRNSGGERT